MATSQTIALFIERLPFPVAIELLQNLEFFGIEQFNGREEERHGADDDSNQPMFAIR